MGCRVGRSCVRVRGVVTGTSAVHVVASSSVVSAPFLPKGVRPFSVAFPPFVPASQLRSSVIEFEPGLAASYTPLLLAGRQVRCASRACRDRGKLVRVALVRSFGAGMSRGGRCVLAGGFSSTHLAPSPCRGPQSDARLPHLRASSRDPPQDKLYLTIGWQISMHMSSTPSSVHRS